MIWWIIATATSAFVKGLCGFANTLVFDTILGFTTDPLQVTPVELVLNAPSNLLVVWRERKHIEWKKCLPITVLIIIGTIPGMLMLKNVDAQWLKVIFGVLVALLGVEMLLRERQKQQMKPNPIVMAAIGLLSGIMCGMFGIGALTAAYMSRVTKDTASFRGNICVAFFTNAVFRCVAYSVLHIITWETLKLSLMLMPVMIIGVLAGMRCTSILPEKTVKRCIIIALIVSGMAMVIKNLI